MSQTDLILGSVIAAVDAVGRGQWDWCTASSTPRSTTGCCSGRTASAVRRGPAMRTGKRRWQQPERTTRGESGE